MPFIHCCYCRVQFEISNNIRTTTAGRCPYRPSCGRPLTLYKCFSCMKVSAMSPTHPPDRCQHCFTMVRSSAPLAPLAPARDFKDRAPIRAAPVRAAPTTVQQLQEFKRAAPVHASLAHTSVPMMADLKGPETATAKILRIAQTKRTTETWFAWGKREHMEAWVKVFSSRQNVIQYALSIKAEIHQGAGLYLAATMMGSSVYAKEGAVVLIATLNNVPTIDLRDNAQVLSLREGAPALAEEDLYQTANLAPFFLMYSKRYKSYGRLTTCEGVELTIDLNRISADVLLAAAGKLGSDAKPVLLAQAIACGLPGDVLGKLKALCS